MIYDKIFLFFHCVFSRKQPVIFSSTSVLAVSNDSLVFFVSKGFFEHFT